MCIDRRAALIPGQARHVDVVIVVVVVIGRGRGWGGRGGGQGDHLGNALVVALEEERVEGVHEPVAEQGCKVSKVYSKFTSLQGWMART